jgi:hypothetical protein
VDDDTLRAWLRSELGLDEYRRVVRESNDVIVISKFEPGFSQELFATVDLLPDLFEDALVAAEYRRLRDACLAHGESPLRTSLWRRASEAILDRLCAERAIDHQRRMYVLPGIESAQAVLDTILWTAPVIGGAYTPALGEIEALHEFELAAAGAARDPFTRYYGQLDGRRVENYCPGAQFGRRLIAQGWSICTHPPAPSP